VRTSTRPSSSRRFWSAALLAAAVVLFGSVELGKSLGASLVARGAGQRPAVQLTAPTKPVSEVLGGQIHAAAAPGQTSPIWIQSQPAASPIPTIEPESEPGE
jgi:hypothetical protein